MASERDLKRRRAWFAAGVADLENVAGRSMNEYACPLCVRTYPGSAIESGELSDEHVPPASMGGKRLVLTCKRCNSVSGHDLDAHLAVAEAHLDLAAGPSGRPVRGTFTLGNASLIGTLAREGDTLLAMGVPKANRPGAPEAIDEQMSATGGGSGRLNFRSHEGWVQGRARIAWTRAAYLASFAIMGYRYILQPELAQVRAQIANPDDESLPGTVTISLDGDVGARRLWLIEEPAWLKSIAVRMRRRTVFLPVTPDPDFFHRLAPQLKRRFNGDGAPLDFRGKQKAWPRAPFGVGGISRRDE
jgi:hypothetical protein